VVVIEHGGPVYDDVQTFVEGFVGSGDFITLENQPIEEMYGDCEQAGAPYRGACLTVVLVDVGTDYGADNMSPIFQNTLFNVGLDFVLTDNVALTLAGFVFPHTMSTFLAKSLETREDDQMSVPPIAYVAPVYIADRDYDWKTDSKSGTVLPYPPDGSHIHESHCGLHQIEELILSSSDIAHIVRSNFSVPLHSELTRKLSPQLFTGRNSYFFPVAFNTRVGYHGQRFVRLPEELNGILCYSTIVLAVLLGGGYDLHWGSLSVRLHASHSSRIYPPTCFCTHARTQKLSGSENWDAHGVDVVKALVRYFRRAQLLRESGTAGLFATEAFEGKYAGK